MKSFATNLTLSLLLFCSPICAEETVDFSKDVGPIFVKHCLRCHQPGEENGDVSLATVDDLLDGEHIVAGDPKESSLIDLITASDGEKPAMPQEAAPLKSEEVATIKRWIAAGAEWPKDVVLIESAESDRSWWSLQPLAETRLPDVSLESTGASIDEETAKAWSEHPIDRFVLRKLIEKEMHPSPPANKRTLIRRATYDLTGLPPTPKEISQFIADNSLDAYEKLIDRLLASPRYGERWGRHWLDVVRFGESNGFERNIVIDNLWPFRDFVIRSINEDKPFDQFIREHLAGDVIGKGKPSVEVGTAFLVCGPYDNVGNQDAVQQAQIRANTIDEMIRATSESFLGLTVGCARCHHHKFDAISQADYYSLYASLAGTHHGARQVATAEQIAARDERVKPLNAEKQELTARRGKIDAAIRKRGDAAEMTEEEKAAIAKIDGEIGAIQQQIAAASALPHWWVGNFAKAEGPFHVFLRGDPQKPGDEALARSLSTLGEVTSEYQLNATEPESQRRLKLADWIVADDNPLSPRVLANRIWHYHFGTGIVDTPSDFGAMGGLPTHRELLDWLARELRTGNWRIKSLHKTIMLSQTYRQSSTHREAAARIDGDSRLLWRFSPRRLSAEEIRDTMLSVSGKLDLKMGGPGFRLYQYLQDNVAMYVPLDTHGAETYRRAVYHQNARAAPIDLMSDFDQPDCAFSTPRRAETTTPLQALTSLNHQFSLDMAKFLAKRVEAESQDRSENIRRIFLLCLGREPEGDELHESLEFVEVESLNAFCRAMLNTSEMIYVR